MDLKALYLRKKFWINDFFHGGKMWSAFKEINYINDNIVEGEKIRQSHLQDILNFAKENVPFYKNIKGVSLSDFPVINKQMILAGRDAFLTPDELIPGQKGKLHITPNGKGTTMQLNLANCYIEILKFDSDEPVADGELGRIVVTDLTNYAMPMIRYDIGDVAMVGEKKSGIMVSIDNLGGRKTDLIIRTDGTQVDFYNSVSPDLFLNEGISQFQFIQKGEKEYLLKLNLKDESLKTMTDRFVGYVKKVVGEDANCKVEYVSEIPVLSSGKRKVVINEWKK